MKEEIKQALDKITPGKWRWIENDLEVRRYGNGNYITWGETDYIIADVWKRKDDECNGELIANTPEWLRWSVERIEQLEEILGFYSIHENYKVQQSIEYGISPSKINIDEGTRARRILGKEE